MSRIWSIAAGGVPLRAVCRPVPFIGGLHASRLGTTKFLAARVRQPTGSKLRSCASRRRPSLPRLQHLLRGPRPLLPRLPSGCARVALRIETTIPSSVRRSPWRRTTPSRQATRKGGLSGSRLWTAAAASRLRPPWRKRRWAALASLRLRLRRPWRKRLSSRPRRRCWEAGSKSAVGSHLAHPFEVDRHEDAFGLRAKQVADVECARDERLLALDPHRAADKRYLPMQRRRLAVADGQRAGHTAVAGQRLRHSQDFVKRRRDNAAVDVAGRPFVLRPERRSAF